MPQHVIVPPAAPTAHADAARGDEVDVASVLNALWRGKLWVLLCTLICGAFGSYFAFQIAVPYYTAASVVMLENRQEQVVDLDSVVSGLSADQATINTEVEVLRARELIEKLVVDMALTQDPEFNTLLQPTPAFLPEAISGALRRVLGLAPPNEAAMSEQQILDATIDAVLLALGVSNLRQSYVFRISATTQNGAKSAAIANRLAALYIQDQLDVKFRATEQATDWLSDRVADLQIALEGAETEVKEFSAQTNLISPDALLALNRQLKELRERQTKAARAANDAAQSLQALQAAFDARDFPQMAALADRAFLSDLLLKTGQGDGTAQQQFLTMFQQIIDDAARDQSRTDQQNATIQTSLTELEAQVKQQSDDLVRLRQMEREAEASRLIYEYFLSRLKETSVQQGIQQADSRILSNAVIPLRPSAPRKSMIVIISLMFGAALGAAIILARDMRQTGVRTAEDLEQITGKTVLGQIPTIGVRQRRKLLQYLIDKPNSQAAEAIRNLRTSLLLSNVDAPPKVIMSTSSVPGEGKTTLALALAQNFSGLEKKVLLIEGDMRRRVFSQYFDIPPDVGLLKVLSGKATVEEAVSYQAEIGADVLVGEPSAINAADVFSSRKFAELLDGARAHYDIIIIDTPPVLVASDARVIGHSVDAILYSVKWDSTPKSQVRSGMRMFETINLSVSGLVLVQIDTQGMKRYGYSAGYGAYGSEYYSN